MGNLISMSPKEIKYYDVIKKLIRNDLNGSEAADALNLTTRHIRRLKGRVAKEGIKGLIHKNRGKESNRKILDKERKEIIAILHSRYHDFKPTFASEKLEEDHNIKRDPKTIRDIMIAEGLWKPKEKKKPKHREWRQRKASFGEMIQYDGSYEYWFEKRNEKYCLLAAIDDATGKVIKAKFVKDEGVFPTFDFWKEYTQEQGKPYSIYVDKFSTYSQNHKLAKENDDALTQFQRAMGKDLNIEVIPANSPQAKGRVERLFQTLQDRLIKELRLNDISNTEEANKFLKETFLSKFNDKFAVEPRSKANLHKKLNQKEKNNLDGIFSKQYPRVVRNDFTISYKNNWYQLDKQQPATIQKKDIITIEERMDGTIKFRLRGKHLNYKILPERPKKIDKAIWVIPANKKRTPYKPKANHPWKRQHLFQKQKSLFKN